jgi:hypothetical protein
VRNLENVETVGAPPRFPRCGKHPLKRAAAAKATSVAFPIAIAVVDINPTR